MQEMDERCCGTGTCILDAQGLCWCGQQWNGLTMCKPAMGHAEPMASAAPAARADQQPVHLDDKHRR